MLKAMKRTTLRCAGFAVFTLCAALPALADSQFRIRRMTRDDVPMGKGQCDIRLQVDNQVEIAVRGDTVASHTLSGRDAYDDGSECNAPLPNRDIVGFNFEVLDQRGEIQLLAEPSRRNNFSAIVQIRDSKGGQGRYHFRISWQMTGGDYRSGNERPGFGRGDDRRPGPPGFSWNNTLSFRGNGRGSASMNDFGDQRLSERHRGYRSRRPHHRRASAASATAICFSTAPSLPARADVLKAEVFYEDRRLRGIMFISVDDRRDAVNAITFEGGDGRDRMRSELGPALANRSGCSPECCGRPHNPSRRRHRLRATSCRRADRSAECKLIWYSPPRPGAKPL